MPEPCVRCPTCAGLTLASKYASLLRRIAFGAPFALAGALVFQVFGTLMSVLVTKTSSFGAPLAAGSLNLTTGRRADIEPMTGALDVLLTTLVFLAPAYRSAAHLAGATVIGAVLYVAMVFALPNATLPVTHVAWWIIGMLPAVVLGLLASLRTLL